MKTFGGVSVEARRFAEVMEKAGLSQQEFAGSLGLSKAHVSNIIQGARRPSRDVLEKLAVRYGVDINRFLFGKGQPEAAHVELFQQDAAAGSGAEIDDYAERSHITVPQSFIAPYRCEHIKAVLVRGDSMIDEKIYDGDYVLFNRKDTSGEGIFVLSIETTLLVKRVAPDPLNSAITLFSANPVYPPRVISGADLETVRIEGKVIGCLHRFHAA
ncbi:MAG: XRE family transcriptional regulator [Spirochaetaceae bacterium]|jgi:SOS-response transcriptional repressor LexA|nr:XRE family transcriptional regulator [Spirochaetaceae bacterium]